MFVLQVYFIYVPLAFFTLYCAEPRRTDDATASCHCSSCLRSRSGVRRRIPRRFLRVVIDKVRFRILGAVLRCPTTGMSVLLLLLFFPTASSSL